MLYSKTGLTMVSNCYSALVYNGAWPLHWSVTATRYWFTMERDLCSIIYTYLYALHS